jgi:hypothetical protein
MWILIPEGLLGHPGLSETMSDDALQIFIQRCREHDGDLQSEKGEELRASTQTFLRAAEPEPELLTRAAALLEGLPPRGAAWLALTFGTAVEMGMNPADTAPALLACLRSWMETLPSISSPDEEDADEDPPEPTARQGQLIEVFPLLCQSIVAHLARLPAERERLARNAELMDRLERLQAYSHGATWIREALLRTSGTLIVLHPPTAQGYELAYENVANCFHLFSLVQVAIGAKLPGGRPNDDAISAACRGKGMRAVHDQAFWHYGDPYCSTPSLQGSVWGEATVRSLPAIEGVRVLLLWPPLLATRSWDSGFFGPHLEALPADISVRRALTRDECSIWMKRLGIDRSTKA